MPKARTKQAPASAADKASSAPTAGTISFRPQDGSCGLSRMAWKSQPFGHEAVKRRQRRNRDATDQEDEGGLRHAVDQAAELFHVAGAGGVEHGAGAEKQQALEQRMIEHMQQRGGERERGGERSCRKP